MDLTAIFESWYIPDGNYPPLNRGQVVRLAFEMQPTSVDPLQDDAAPTMMCPRGDAEYEIVARVMRLYDSLTVFESGEFRFYVEHGDLPSLRLDNWVRMKGTLLVDHYAWAEYWNRYVDPPALFYTLRLSQIRKVLIPERFIGRQEGGKALPTRVSPSDFGEVEELESMEGQTFDEEFFVLRFEDAGLVGRMAPTFIGGPAA